MDYLFDKNAINTDFLCDVDYCVWYLSHFKWPFSIDRFYSYFWESWFPFCEEPVFDELILLFDKNKIFKSPFNVDLMYGIGKGKLMNKLGYPPTESAIFHSLKLWGSWYYSGLLQEDEIKKIRIKNYE